MLRRLNKKLLLGATAALCLCLFGFPGHAKVDAAAPAFSLTTSPISEDLRIKPGTTNVSTLQVMNNNTTPVGVTVQLEVFSASGTDGSAAINQLSPNSPEAAWVHFSTTSFVAKPGVYTPIKMTIDLPVSAELGYYYAVLFKPTLPSSSVPHTTTIKGANAVLVLVDTNSANEDRQLTVSNFSTSKKLYQYLPASFNVTVKNGGNIFLAPEGNIFISKSSNFSHPLAVLDINSGGGNVLPNSIRIFNTKWSSGFPVYKDKLIDGQPYNLKNGQPAEKLTWNFGNISQLRFGKYYAHLALVYNDGKQEIPVNSVLSFWVIPWKLILILLVLLIIILVGFFSLGKGIFSRARGLSRSTRKAKKS